MGLYGSSGGGSRAGIYGRAGHAAPSKKKQHHGLLHNIVHGGGSFIGHLATDIEHAAVGLPAGVVNMAKHPIRSIEEIGKTTWHDWSPLFHGDVGKFAHNFFEHPLAPLLDIASVATLGAGLAGRGGAALAEAGMISKESKLGKLGAGYGKDASKVRDIAHHGPQGTVYAHRAANPLTRGLQNAGSAAVNRVMPNWKGGEYTRLIEKDTARRGVTVSHINSDVRAAMNGVFNASDTLAHHPHEYFKVVEQSMHESLGRFARNVTQEHADAMIVTKASRKSKSKVIARAGDVDPTTPIFRAPKGVAFVRKENPATPGISSMEDVELHLKSFGKRHTVKEARADEILLDEHGNPLVVPDHNVNLLAQEAVNSTKLMKAIYHRPTMIWKWAVLQTPRFFVNNAVGNTLMAMVALNPISFTHGLLNAVQDARGYRTAMKAAKAFDADSKTMTATLGRALGHGDDVVDKWYLGPHRTGFAYEASQSSQLYKKLEEAGADPRIVKAAKVGQNGLFNFTHRVAETGIRRIGISELLRKSPEVKALMKKGKSFREAADEVSHDPAFRSRMQHEMDNILGQYHYYNGLEQHFRKLIPFYGWDRAIMRHARTMALEHPGRTAALAQVGNQGIEETHKALGDIPSFMESLLPLGGNKVMSTTGINPYASVPETINPILAAIGVGKHKPGEALSMQLNPFITGLIETTTGQSLLSGAKLPHRSGGIIGQTASNVVEGIPQVKLLETLLKGEDKPKRNKRTGKVTQFLYRKDARAQIAALLGVPVKELNKQRAHELARRERGEKKGRSSSSSTRGIYG